MKVNKKTIAFLAIIALAIVITFVCVYANSIEKGKEFNVDDYTVISEGTGVSIVSYNGDSTTLVIPAKLGGKKVVSISQDAFKDSKVKNISFASDANNVTLNDKCFANNTTIVSVKLPSSLKAIPTYCFYKCTALKSVTMPNSIEYIGSYAFYGCTVFTNDIEQDTSGYRWLNLPTSLKEICDFAFYDCDALDCVKVSSKLKVVGNYAFAESAMQKLGLYQSDSSTGFGIEQIGNYAFYKSYLYSQSGSEIYLPKLTKIGNYAFANTQTNFKYFRIAPSVTTIGEYAFAGSNALTTIKFEQESDSETITLGVNTFANCVKLVSVKMVDKITAIPANMFKGCVRLLYSENLDLGQNVSSIGNGAFSLFDTSATDSKYCKYTVRFSFKPEGSDTVTYRDFNSNFQVTKLLDYTTTYTNATTHFAITNYDKTELIAYVGLFGYNDTDYAVIDSTNTYSFKFLIEQLDGITKIDSYAFAGALFTKLVLPSTVVNVSDYSLSNSAISALYFHGDSITKTITIGDKAFDNLKSSNFMCFVFTTNLTGFRNSELYARLLELGIDCERSQNNLN